MSISHTIINKSFQRGYVGLLALLIACAVLVFMMTKKKTSPSDGTTNIQEGKSIVNEASDIKHMIESRHGEAMENL